ncbi:hypothetical protein A33Q_1414 [Indibacter alkaliphilus LW1]|uniref:Uncharacterized protein n=1 Tax=Indibacter alkaliphilus (strain CCUG 57479 / KCTC 22604 / LW1) TaxID=1189612 RepID=S2DNF4_INDAL|nr:hypothetical protein A33Q_1414 [Indibacter alkaliphilus LW1]
MRIVRFIQFLLFKKLRGMVPPLKMNFNNFGNSLFQFLI